MCRFFSKTGQIINTRRQQIKLCDSDAKRSKNGRFQNATGDLRRSGKTEIPFHSSVMDEAGSCDHRRHRYGFKTITHHPVCINIKPFTVKKYAT